MAGSALTLNIRA